jgi:hypothetical protein
MIDLYKPALLFSIPYGIGLAIGAINRAAAPYVAPFYYWGTVLSVVFIVLFWGHAVSVRRRNRQTPTVSTSTSLVLTQG